MFDPDQLHDDYENLVALAKQHAENQVNKSHCAYAVDDIINADLRIRSQLVTLFPSLSKLSDTYGRPFSTIVPVVPETTDTIHTAMGNMKSQGGSFARCLAEAWFRADYHNRAKIEAAFSDLIKTYMPQEETQ
jgi:hypothetical protein